MWAIFITAGPPPKASTILLLRCSIHTDCLQILNRGLLLLQDFEFGDYPEDSQLTLLTSTKLPAEAPGATALPVSDINGSNDFASMSFVEINAFIRANEGALEKIDLSSGNWIIIDQKGFETSTCLVCEQVYDEADEGGEQTADFRACRLPYEEAHSMIANLDIANMGFEDFVDEEAGEQADGAWRWQSFERGDMSDGDIMREKALQELRDGGYAD
ncbi:hypothetical protein K438DRAFT_2030328 [Mycena galopus ATCC 62051]|nr:hypothetical protein K438DRAFT_2030328 [Mycena galopus ATCC 62051]